MIIILVYCTSVLNKIVQEMYTFDTSTPGELVINLSLCKNQRAQPAMILTHRTFTRSNKLRYCES